MSKDITPEAFELDTIDCTPSKTGEGTVVRFSCPEFTSMCPLLRQPDFARIYIDYIPMHKLVESKSLKLYLQSFRNHSAFHEETAASIARKFLEACNPKWIRVVTYWYPRGGIPIDTYFQTGEPPKGYYIPSVELPLFSGR